MKTTKYIFSLLLANWLAFQPAFAAFTEVEKGQVFAQNLLDNPGFENGKAKWTPNDTADFSIDTSTPLIGNASALWDADASSDTLTSTAVTIPPGMYGRNMVVSCLFVTASGTATHEIQAYDGSNILAEATITSSTTPTRTSVNFVAPSSGSISARIFANADEPETEIDSCVVGPAEGYNVSNVSQSRLVGVATYPATASCAWARTNTSAGEFTADTDAPAPTVTSNPGPGTISTTDNNLPQITITNLPPGVYNVKATVGVVQGASAVGVLQINDGTTTGPRIGFNSVNTTNESVTVTATFTYTTAQSSITYKLYGLTSSSSLTIDCANYDSVFEIYRFPTTQETAYTADVTNWRVDANLSGSTNFALGSSNQTAYIGMTNSGITLTNNATATATAQVPCATTTAPSGTTCTAADESNGVAFTIPRAGTYEACVEFTHQAAGSGSPVVATTFQIVETPTNAQTISQEGKSRVSSGIGTASNMFFPHNLCGTFKFGSVGQKVLRLMYEQSITATVATNEIIADGNTSLGQRDVHWTVKAVDQSFPAPNLVNSVVSNNSGIRKQIHAELDCEAGSSIFNQTGSTSNGVSSIGNISAGACVVNFAAGTFSAAPYCQATAIIGDGAGDVLDIGFTASPTTSSVTVDCHINSSTDCTSYTFHLFCDGAK